MPPKSIRNAAAGAQKLGTVQPIGAFFAVKKTPSCPKKKRKGTIESIFADADKRQKPAAAAPAAVLEAQAQAEVAPEAEAQAKRQASVAKAQQPAKKARQNYTGGPNKEKMNVAIMAFRKRPIGPLTGKPVSQNDFAKRVKIPRVRGRT